MSDTCLPACVVGRLDVDGPWLGFAPALEDGYALVIGDAGSSRRIPASGDDLVAMAIAYFEESLVDPPEAVAATHGDIGTLVRHVAEHEPDADQRSLLAEAVDAIDDGQAADVVMGRLAAAFGEGRNALTHLRGRSGAAK